MKKLEREDLFKLIYKAAEYTFGEDKNYKITKIGKENQDVEFEDLSDKERNMYVEAVKEEVFKDKKSITTGNGTSMEFKAKRSDTRIRERANFEFYDELMRYYEDNEYYLEDFEEDSDYLMPFIEQELAKENDEFFEKYQAMPEREYDFEQDFEEEYDEELSEQEFLEKKIEAIKGMSNEDFQRLVYMTALEVSNKMSISNENEKSLLEKDEDERKTYIACAQRSALKSFSSHPDLVFSSLMGIGKDTPEELKKIIMKQLLFDSVYNEIFEGYMSVKDKEKFFENIDKNFGVDISKIALEDMNSDMSKEFFDKIEESKGNFNHDDKIKASVIEFWLNCLKEKHPDLSEKNQKKFSDTLMKHINYSYDSWRGSTLSVDYDPCQELIDAYYSMDIKPGIFGPKGEFPYKTTTFTQKGKYAKVSGDYGKSQYLYMSPEYLEEAKKDIYERIAKEEEKVPEEKINEWKQEYKQKSEVQSKRQAEIDAIKEKIKQAEEKVESLLISYSDRVAELESLNLTDEERENRKQSIIKEINEAIQTRQNINEFEEYGAVNEKYDYATFSLERYDGKKYDEKSWMEKEILSYTSKQRQIRFEEHEKTLKPGEFSFPDTKDLPSGDLARMYDERDAIQEYEEKQKRKEELEQTGVTISEDIINAVATAYFDKSTKYGYIGNQDKEKLQKELYEYFKNNSSKLTDSQFLVDFENEVLDTIKRKYNIRVDIGLYNRKREIASVVAEDGIVYTNNGIRGKKVYYGEPEVVQKMIKEIDSKIAFYKDSNDETMKVYYLELEKESLQEYLGKENEKDEDEKTLYEIDDELMYLEEREKQLQQLEVDMLRNGKNKGEIVE